MWRLIVVFVAAATVAAAVAISYGALTPDPLGPRSTDLAVVAGGPLPLTAEPDPDDPLADLNAPPVALAPPGGAIVQQGIVRIPKPKLDLAGQRRVGIQIGHWQTDDVPKEYGTRILTQTGTSWGGVSEVDVTSEIADRMATLLEAQGVAVDILPTTVPLGYVADVFIALHCDGDGVGVLSGFKMAHGARRGPYEDKLMTTIKDVYMVVTGMDYDLDHVTRSMSSYFAFNWSRYQHATSPFTPSTIIELGFLSNADDRDLLENKQDLLAGALTTGILKFLDDTPRSKIFGADLLIAAAPFRQGPAPSPTTPP